ncbi:MAG: hypothetical protein ACM3XP_02730 [Nitrososphaerales archaeon]
MSISNNACGTPNSSLNKVALSSAKLINRLAICDWVGPPSPPPTSSPSSPSSLYSPLLLLLFLLV